MGNDHYVCNFPAKNHPGHPLPGGSAGKDLRSKARNSNGMPGASVFLRLQGLGLRLLLRFPNARRTGPGFSFGAPKHEAGIPGQIHQTTLRGRLFRRPGSGAFIPSGLSGCHGLSPRLLRYRRKSSQLYLPVRPSSYRRLPRGYLDPEDPAAGIRAQKPLRGVGSPGPPLPGTGSRKLFLL